MPPSLTQAVEAEISRCGSLDAAIAQLANDACGAQWGAPVHDIYKAALAFKAEQEEAADPVLKARRLRLKASDAWAAYDRHMKDYGSEIGRATHREAQGELTLAKLHESAATGALLAASDCLTEALGCEIEADRIEADNRPFVTLFDNVSARCAPQAAAE